MSYIYTTTQEGQNLIDQFTLLCSKLKQQSSDRRMPLALEVAKEETEHPEWMTDVILERGKTVMDLNDCFNDISRCGIPFWVLWRISRE